MWDNFFLFDPVFIKTKRQLYISIIHSYAFSFKLTSQTRICVNNFSFFPNKMRIDDLGQCFSLEFVVYYCLGSIVWKNNRDVCNDQYWWRSDYLQFLKVYSLSKISLTKENVLHLNYIWKILKYLLQLKKDRCQNTVLLSRKCPPSFQNKNIFLTSAMRIYIVYPGKTVCLFGYSLERSIRFAPNYTHSKITKNWISHREQRKCPISEYRIVLIRSKLVWKWTISDHSCYQSPQSVNILIITEKSDQLQISHIPIVLPTLYLLWR